MTQNGVVTFPKFDVVSDPSDHAFAVEKHKPKPYAASVHKTITKEWRILAENLPDSIFVRVYDTRVELLRAAIIGASGTPYHDALFFFDVKFPPEYPSLPPSVHYRSYGLRVNPNLYANGGVCLSLLNTWHGMKREKWDPRQSTVLQVLLSLQALVLNEKPYFNEPGVEWPGAASPLTPESISSAYNEQVFVLTCKTTLFNLRDPPRNFEALTAAHYRERARRILCACGAYVDGRVRAGYYDEEADVAKNRKVVWEGSTVFKTSVKSLYPQLVFAFVKNGSVGLVEELKGEAETTSVNVEAKIKTTSVDVEAKIKTTSVDVEAIIKTASLKVKGDKEVKKFAMKVIGKLTKFLGLSKKKKKNV